MDKDMQTKYMELQMLDQQIKQIQKNSELIENQIEELHLVIQALDDLSKAEVGSDVLVPLSGGVFVKAKLEDNKNLLINVGAGVSAKKTIPETKELIEKQIKEIEKAKIELVGELQNFAKKAQTIQEELQKAAMEESKEK